AIATIGPDDAEPPYERYVSAMMDV
ncbi:hypothetical protein LCGC14_2085290, partial [marine sediment metagenome]